MAKTKSVMKHIAVILAIFTVLFFLGGCSSTPTPTETTDTFLQALKAQDGETMASVYSGTDLDLLEAASDSEEETTDDEESSVFDSAFEDQLMPKMLDFDYEISNEQIDGDKATVDVKFTTYRIGDAFSAWDDEE